MNWIKCRDKMPPNTNKMFIIHKIGDDYRFVSLRSGFVYNQFVRNSHNYEWIPYTERDWKELNK